MTIAILEPSPARTSQLVLRLRRLLCGEGELFTAGSAGELLSLIDGRGADMVLMRAELPDMRWTELAAGLRRRLPLAKLVLMSESDTYALEAIRLHMHDYLLIPVDDRRLLHVFTGIDENEEEIC